MIIVVCSFIAIQDWSTTVTVHAHMHLVSYHYYMYGHNCQQENNCYSLVTQCFVSHYNTLHEIRVKHITNPLDMCMHYMLTL